MFRKTVWWMIGIVVLFGLNGCLEDRTRPVFTSPDSVTIPENQLEVMTLTADDANPVTFGVRDEDAESFEINATTGEMRFKTAPDFETKDTYTVTALATDSFGNIATQLLTIHITNDACVDGDVISHNGTDYCAVVSPYTHRRWLDRNLGALRVCEGYADSACNGDFYQWGREADGHQEANSTTNETQATDAANVGHASFILSTDEHEGDWALDADTDGSQRSTGWQVLDGSSICPTGYRVPTLGEWKAELFDAGSARIDQNSTQQSANSDDRRVNAYRTFLKLPAAGYRDYEDGSMIGTYSMGSLWSVSISGTGASAVAFGENAADWAEDEFRAIGHSVRCIEASGE